MRNYLVIYEQGEGGSWGARCPDLPGVVAAGESRAEVEKLIAEAVSGYLKFLGESGEPAPRPASDVGFVTV